MMLNPDMRDMTIEALEARIEEEGDNLDGADIYGVIATVADFLDIDLEAALSVSSAEADITDELEDRINLLSRGETRLIADLVENSQSNPSSAYPTLLLMVRMDNEIARRDDEDLADSP